jgi:hypothetical protein
MVWVQSGHRDVVKLEVKVETDPRIRHLEYHHGDNVLHSAIRVADQGLALSVNT